MEREKTFSYAFLGGRTEGQPVCPFELVPLPFFLGAASTFSSSTCEAEGISLSAAGFGICTSSLVLSQFYQHIKSKNNYDTIIHNPNPIPKNIQAKINNFFLKTQIQFTKTAEGKQ
jgi:hypothetical protein